jgi:hypothetical protein
MDAGGNHLFERILAVFEHPRDDVVASHLEGQGEEDAEAETESTENHPMDQGARLDRGDYGKICGSRVHGLRKNPFGECSALFVPTLARTPQSRAKCHNPAPAWGFLAHRRRAPWRQRRLSFVSQVLQDTTKNR